MFRTELGKFGRLYPTASITSADDRDRPPRPRAWI